MQLIPRNDLVLIERTSIKKEVKKGSIILADDVTVVTNTVIAIGGTVADLKVDDIVLLRKHCDELPVDKKFGENLFLIKESDIIAVEHK